MALLRWVAAKRRESEAFYWRSGTLRDEEYGDVKDKPQPSPVSTDSDSPEAPTDEEAKEEAPDSPEAPEEEANGEEAQAAEEEGEAPAAAASAAVEEEEALAAGAPAVGRSLINRALDYSRALAEVAEVERQLHEAQRVAQGVARRPVGMAPTLPLRRRRRGAEAPNVRRRRQRDAATHARAGPRQLK